MTRLEKWNKSEEESRCLSATCTVKRCWCRFLRFTPSGYYCKEHYFNMKDCSILDCDNPALEEEGVCRDHLFGEMTEEEKTAILFRRVESNISQAQNIVLNPYEYREHWLKKKRKK